MKKLKVLLGALSLLTVGATNAGTLVLDSFNYNPILNLTTNSGTLNASDTVTSAETGALAAYDLNYTAAPTSGSAGASGNVAFVSDGVLSYDETNFGNGTLQIDYSLPIFGATLDFTGYSDFYFDVIGIDGSGGFDIVLTLKDADGTTISANFNISSVGTFMTSLGAMVIGAAGTTAGFDFSQVSAASAFISSPGGGDDFTLDSVGLVPAPASLALLGLGLIGMGLRSRKSH